MKRLIILLAIAMTAQFTFAQEANKTYVKTVDPQASQYITLEMNYPVTANEWDQEKIRILVDVTLTNANDKILEQLMLAGRYKIASRKEAERFLIDIPGLKKEVTIKGQKLEEEIELVILVPKYTSVETTSQDGISMVTIEKGGNLPAGLTAKGDPFGEELLEVEFNFNFKDEVPTSKDTEDVETLIEEMTTKREALKLKMEKVKREKEAMMSQLQREIDQISKRIEELRNQ